MFARGLAAFTLVAAAGVGLASCAPPPAPVLKESVTAPLPPVPSTIPENKGPTVSSGIRDAAALRKEYGKPDFVRTEADSEMWRYDGANCALFLFLYRDHDSLQLKHMETLPRGAKEAADEACLASVKSRLTPAS